MVEVNRFSPCTSVVRTRNQGAVTWAERCVRPRPWIASAARQPGSTK